MTALPKYAFRLAIGFAGAAFGALLEAIDQHQISLAAAFTRDANDAFRAALVRRTTGTTVNTELARRSPLEIIREKKSEFDDAFADHQAKVNQVFPAASFGFGRNSNEFKKFKYLYEDQLAVCLLKPMRDNIEVRYRCTVAGGQNCVQEIRNLGAGKCGMDKGEYVTLSVKAKSCIGELQAALNQSVQTRVRYLGVAGRLEFVWRTLIGADTETTTEGRSWRKTLLGADTHHCRLRPAFVADAQEN